ncbi:MAG: hypothetical protein E7262_10900 [Lachnospiraceae bacterium]|nr:hypothetical protein [Lachnospiraceae bacterium]
MKKVTKTQVSVNGNKVTLETKENLTVLDALIEAGYSREQIMPRDYKYVEIEYNGEPRKVHFGFESATKVFLNKERAGLISLINNGDSIDVEEFMVGDDTTIKLSKLEDYNENIIFDIDGKPVSLIRLVEINGRLNFGDVEVKRGDIVKSYNYYTAAQLREILGLEEDIIIMSEDKELEGDDAIYEETVVDTYVRFTDNNYSNNNFINNRETSTFKLLVGDDLEFNKEVEEEVKPVVVDEAEEIRVIMNGETVCLSNKKSYAVIDALDAAGIDALQAVGKDIYITVNGMNGSFSTVISHDDVVEFSYN